MYKIFGKGRERDEFRAFFRLKSRKVAIFFGFGQKNIVSVCKLMIIM